MIGGDGTGNSTAKFSPAQVTLGAASQSPRHGAGDDTPITPPPLSSSIRGTTVAVAGDPASAMAPDRLAFGGRGTETTAAKEGEKRTRVAQATPGSGWSKPDVRQGRAEPDTSQATANPQGITLQGTCQANFQKIREIIRGLPGVFVAHSGAGSDYYILASGHTVRVATHSNYGYSGQAVDIDVQPITDEWSQSTDDYELKAGLGFDCEANTTRYFRRAVIDAATLKAAVAEAVKERAATAMEDNCHIMGAIGDALAAGRWVPPAAMAKYNRTPQGRAEAARRAHNPEVAGSNPAPAITVGCTASESGSESGTCPAAVGTGSDSKPTAAND